jgi:hypothetical protein
MQWESVLAWRMERQHLTRRATDALGVVSDICGLHAQVMSSAQATLDVRLEEPVDVAALPLVKTWAMRGTLHLLPAGELGLYVGAQGALRPRYERASWQKHFGVTLEEMERLIEEVPKALADGPLNREELAARVHPGLARGYGDLLKPLAFRGDIVVTADKRFALPEPFERLDTDQATRELARRFLARYGPASREDFQKWFGAPSPAAPGRWIRALDDVVETELGFLLGADAAACERARPSGAVRLLPAFDQYVVAAPRDTRATSHPERIYRPGGWFSPVLRVDGVMAGVWSREGDAVAIEPFADIGAEARAAAEAEAARLAGTPAVIWRS